ncbi:glyoxal oxidase-related protein [Actinidia rufa]|uniref:Glyoxal oxidase-related protein n=1 Tax=Actinidia rufa TaxID=165716 RepID=A0A7J0FXE2_9ERIC|nr:glyoxal oxidase-related protein [Actinidia rufa]
MCQTWSSTSSRQGEWRLLHSSIGISAMHMQLLRNNKVVMFDRTDFGPSNLSLPGGLCRHDRADTVLQNDDCTAHSLLYDVGTNTVRPLMIQTDTWCSSGSVFPDGTLVQTGGYNDGDHTVRILAPCIDNYCDWIEVHDYLSERRWYATNQILSDGRIIIVGGRRQFTYEFYPRSSQASSPSSNTFWLNFLRETRDDDENNLYPFVHLLPNGNLFVFANTRAISLDYKQNVVVTEFPAIPGGDPRNYPSSGSSVLLPMNDVQNESIEAEIMICGGAPRGAFSLAMHGTFVRANPTCGRIKVTDENPSWAMEIMPVARVMGDMVILPTGDVIIINGAGQGDRQGGKTGGTRLPVSKTGNCFGPRIVAPSFATHAFGMNQRMVVLKTIATAVVGSGTCRVTAVGPSTAEIAPPGYYMLFVVHAGVPSSGMWVRIQ